MLKDLKKAGGGFQNESQWVKVSYDFDEDGGAIADYDVLEATSDIVVLRFFASVQTAVTSGGLMVVDLGIGDGGTEIWSDKAVAALSAGAYIEADAAGGIKVASGSKIVMGIEAFAATAGKVDFYFEVKKL